MNLTTLLRFGEGITPDTPIGERVTFGLQVVGIGMGVVFGVLLILIGILQLFKLFSVKKPAEQKKSEPVFATPTPTATAPAANAPASEEETVVAVATAAIAASRGESECAFNIISIKKIVK